MFRQIMRRHMSTKRAHPRPDVRPPVDLDPSYERLLKDIDVSLAKHDTSSHSHVHQELEVLKDVENGTGYGDLDYVEFERKSPAAIFGSQAIGAVVLPHELRDAIGVLIKESDKTRLRQDAQRLFSESEGDWHTTFDAKYKSFEQRKRHGERDGTAFATVALPAHYSAILSVFRHITHRMGPNWKVDHVVDWGAATGSALWAALHAFQSSDTDIPAEDVKAADSTVKTYMGIDKRVGLVDIAKKILREIPLSPDADISFRKGYPYPLPDPVPNTLAINAFSLSSLPTDIYRKRAIKEMWDSGAETIVLIDHANKDGFAAIVEGRQALLRMSRNIADPDGELEDEVDGEHIVANTNGEHTGDEIPESDLASEGAHIIAPCPHERACPLHGTRLHCSFGQRIQRPDFVRRTKNSGVGHEDVEYSYVVVRRGPRPERVGMDSDVGRIGRVGALQAEKEAAKGIREVVITEGAGELEARPDDAMNLTSAKDLESMNDNLRQESFSWPRVIFPPLKKGGHIILDTCSPNGRIERMTIPRSQGKQEYYDARKSSWGDIFPHPPKNAPMDRYQPKRAKKEGPIVRGGDIGKGQVKKQKKAENLSREKRATKLQKERKEVRQHKEAHLVD